MDENKSPIAELGGRSARREEAGKMDAAKADGGKSEPGERQPNPKADKPDTVEKMLEKLTGEGPSVGLNGDVAKTEVRARGRPRKSKPPQGNAAPTPTKKVSKRHIVEWVEDSDENDFKGFEPQQSPYPGLAIVEKLLGMGLGAFGEEGKFVF